MPFNITGAFYRLLRTGLETGGKVLALIFRKNQKALDFFRSVNRRINASLTRSSLPAGGPVSYGEIRGGLGVNVAGYITSESGMGEAARANIRSLQKAGIPFALNNLSSFATQKDLTYGDFVRKNPFAINLVHVTADQVPAFYREQGARYFRNRYNIGVWYWELSRFPGEWHDRFAYFHEIWVATEFCRAAVAEQAPIPVVKIPPSLLMEPAPPVDRARFGIAEGAFVFCCLFSFLSVFERKNPIAAIEAFRRAFRPGDKAVLLVKSSHADLNPRAKEMMTEAARGLQVIFLEKDMRRQELYALLSSIDCFVSLHRSEGFGLPIAEAMYLKKPAIATAYSGNMDFMTADNSYPVRYELSELERDYGPYKKGNVWATPDIGHAAGLMRQVYEQRDAARRVGEQASHDIKTLFSPGAAGGKIAERVKTIAKEKGLSADR
ncbi:MAG TPA: glycosyltransferase family 4 protein [Nitrospirota bacterium]